MPDELAERISVGAPPAHVYRAVSDVKPMARWSPECFAALVWSRREGGARPVRSPEPARAVGLVHHLPGGGRQARRGVRVRRDDVRDAGVAVGATGSLRSTGAPR